MRILGVLGGMSWESSAVYYRLLNQGVGQRLGGLHSAPLVLHSVDFAPLAAMQAAGDWAGASAVLMAAATGLRQAGASALVLATNTMHKVADRIEAEAGLPLLHIADATGAALRAAGVRRAALLGTRFTMEHDFYKGRLVERFGLDVLIPDAPDRREVHRVIYEELVLGNVYEESRQEYIRIMENLVAAGAEGIILGCTEIELLVKPGDSRVPLFPTTRIHAEAAVEYALAE